jgi:hypothetical protein
MKILVSPLPGSSAEITPRVMSSVHLNPSWYEFRIRTFFLPPIRVSAEAVDFDGKKMHREIMKKSATSLKVRIRAGIMVKFLIGFQPEFPDGN